MQNGSSLLGVSAFDGFQGFIVVDVTDFAGPTHSILEHSNALEFL